MVDDPLAHAVMVEVGYGLILKSLFPDSKRTPADPEVAALLHQLIGLAPSEFFKMDNRQRLPFIKQAAAAKKASEKAAPVSPPKPVGRPKKNQPRATVNARMLDELGRNPDSKTWTSREWAKRLSCAKSAVEKTKAWQAIIEMRESDKSDRKTKTSRRYDQ